MATTGFVSAQAGSVSSANAVLLRELVSRGVKIDFFSKPSFVDPRPAVEDQVLKDALLLVDCTNHFGDRLRRSLSPNGRGLWGRLWASIDSATYNQGVVRKMRRHRAADIDLWLGDWARGRGARRVVTYAQGPPGTDARSVLQHRALIERLGGRLLATKLRLFANYRLTIGLPNFSFSDQIIVGSEWSRQCLHGIYGVPFTRSAAIPYPIDLQMFRPLGTKRSSRCPLKLLWLGRFAPRKRLDLFLNGLAIAIRHGCNVTATIVGRSDFVPNYERLIAEFAFPDRVTHVDRVPRMDVPQLIWAHDVMCQPSDEENFGSSVAEALACGIPAIVGATNGTADYICERSIQLQDDSEEEMAAAICQLADAKQAGDLGDPIPSRLVAEKHFMVAKIVDRLLETIKAAKLK